MAEKKTKPPIRNLNTILSSYAPLSNKLLDFLPDWESTLQLGKTSKSARTHTQKRKADCHENRKACISLLQSSKSHACTTYCFAYFASHLRTHLEGLFVLGSDYTDVDDYRKRVTWIISDQNRFQKVELLFDFEIDECQIELKFDPKNQVQADFVNKWGPKKGSVSVHQHMAVGNSWNKTCRLLLSLLPTADDKDKEITLFVEDVVDLDTFERETIVPPVLDFELGNDPKLMHARFKKRSQSERWLKKFFKKSKIDLVIDYVIL
jgi:hypothetical protein